eukprot:scaffold72742_cov60-Phaeocystis_antarctica.AAC.2
MGLPLHYSTVFGRRNALMTDTRGQLGDPNLRSPRLRASPTCDERSETKQSESKTLTNGSPFTCIVRVTRVGQSLRPWGRVSDLVHGGSRRSRTLAGAGWGHGASTRQTNDRLEVLQALR